MQRLSATMSQMLRNPVTLPHALSYIIEQGKNLQEPYERKHDSDLVVDSEAKKKYELADGGARVDRKVAQLFESPPSSVAARRKCLLVRVVCGGTVVTCGIQGEYVLTFEYWIAAQRCCISFSKPVSSNIALANL
jgi:hypothetical protein